MNHLEQVGKDFQDWLSRIAEGTEPFPQQDVDPILRMAHNAGDHPIVGLILLALAQGLPTHRVTELSSFVRPTKNGIHAAQAMLILACAAPQGEVETVMPGLPEALAQLRTVDFIGQAENPHIGRAIQAHLLALEALTGGDVSATGPTATVARILLSENAKVTGSKRASDAAALVKD